MYDEQALSSLQVKKMSEIATDNNLAHRSYKQFFVDLKCVPVVMNGFIWEYLILTY